MFQETAKQHEQVIASTLMHNVMLTGKLLGVLNPAHFADEVCRSIFELATDAYIKKKPFTDHLALLALPTKSKEVVSITTQQAVSSGTLTLLADGIIDASARRNILIELDRVKKDVESGGTYDLTVLSKTEVLGQTSIPSNGEIIDAMNERIQNPIKDPGTGIKYLDQMMSLEPGDLVVLAGRPSMGKTGLVATVINHLLSNKEGSIFFSLEMPSLQIMMRMFANRSEESLNDIKNSRIKDYSKYKATEDFFRSTEMFTLIDNSLTALQIYNISMSEKAKKPWLKNIFIDHIDHVKSTEDNKRDDIRIGDDAKIFKKLAKDGGLKVWLLSQLNRGVENRPNKRPGPADLKNSGSLEELADELVFVYRDSYYKTKEDGTNEAPINEAELILGKNRNGPTGSAKTNFVGPIMKFTDAAGEYYGAEEVHVYEFAEGEEDALMSEIVYEDAPLIVELPPI